MPSDVESHLTEAQRLTADARVRLERMLEDLTAFRAGLEDQRAGRDVPPPVSAGGEALPSHPPEAAAPEGFPSLPQLGEDENELLLEDLEPVSEGEKK